MLHSPDWPLVSHAVALLFGYLLGSIPFGLLLTQVAGTEDLRSIGSGNIGATNVLRTGHKGLAAATLVGDVLKGTAAVLIADRYGGQYLAISAGLGAFLGHLFPIWLRFRGGKGVATYIGVLLALAWPVAVGFCAVWLAVAALTRYSSAAALAASVSAPPVLWLSGSPDAALLFAFLSVLLWLKHAGNIRRLATGGESKIGSRARGPTREG